MKEQRKEERARTNSGDEETRGPLGWRATLPIHWRLLGTGKVQTLQRVTCLRGGTNKSRSCKQTNKQKPALHCREAQFSSRGCWEQLSAASQAFGREAWNGCQNKTPTKFATPERQKLHLFSISSIVLNTKIHQGWAFGQENMGVNLIQLPQHCADFLNYWEKKRNRSQGPPFKPTWNRGCNSPNSWVDSRPLPPATTPPPPPGWRALTAFLTTPPVVYTALSLWLLGKHKSPYFTYQLPSFLTMLDTWAVFWCGWGHRRKMAEGEEENWNLVGGETNPHPQNYSFFVSFQLPWARE